MNRLRVHIKYVFSSLHVSSFFYHVCDITGFVNPQISISAVEAATSQVVDPFPSGVERVQQHTVEQIVHVPTPRIQKQIVESCQVISRELFLERIEVQIVDIPVPPIVKRQWKLPSPVIEHIAPAPSVTHVTPREQFSPAYNMTAVATGVSLDTTCLMNPQCAITTLEEQIVARR